MPYIKISEHLNRAINEEATRKNMSPEDILERTYYGYAEKVETAEDAKRALNKYAASEQDRYAAIKKWVEEKTISLNGQALLVEYDKIFMENEDNEKK